MYLLLEVPVEFGARGDRVTGILPFSAKASVKRGIACNWDNCCVQRYVMDFQF